MSYYLWKVTFTMFSLLFILDNHVIALSANLVMYSVFFKLVPSSTQFSELANRTSGDRP